MTTSNLRRDVRVPARIPVVLRRGRASVALETHDVSFKGLFLRTAEPAPLRSLVRLEIALPTGELRTHAMVVHVVGEDPRAVGMGLQFWGLTGADRTSWDAFVTQLREAQRPGSTSAHPAASEAPSGVRVVGGARPDAPDGVHLCEVTAQRRR